MSFYTESAPRAQAEYLLLPRPHQIEAAAKFDSAIWNEEGLPFLQADRPTTQPGHQLRSARRDKSDPRSRRGAALLVAPVATGKTLILVMIAVAAIERGWKLIVVVSRSRHVAGQSLWTLEAFRHARC